MVRELALDPPRRDPGLVDPEQDLEKQQGLIDGIPPSVGLDPSKYQNFAVTDDAEAARALFFLLERTKHLTEPASSCCLAAAERQRGAFTTDDRIVIVLCGGNVSSAAQTVARAMNAAS